MLMSDTLIVGEVLSNYVLCGFWDQQVLFYHFDNLRIYIIIIVWDNDILKSTIIRWWH